MTFKLTVVNFSYQMILILKKNHIFEIIQSKHFSTIYVLILKNDDVNDFLSNNSTKADYSHGNICHVISFN